MKMSRVFVSVLLVCVCSVCVCVDLPRDFGVKLCGREFIRAVIFTCGGSRWRRSTYSHFLLDSDLNSLDTDGESPSELLQQLMGEQTQADALATLFSRGSGSSWPSADRRKRNLSLGLAGMCCSQGCTKNDIGRLC